MSARLRVQFPSHHPSANAAVKHSEQGDIDVALNTPTDQETEVVLPAEVPEDLPLPSDPKVIFLGGLFVLAVLAAAYVASEIVLPLVFAIVLKLLLQPALRALGAAALTADTCGAAADHCAIRNDRRLGHRHFRPRSHLGAKLPEGIPRLEERLSFMRAPINTAADIFAAGGGFWRNGTISKCGHPGARLQRF